MTLHDGNIVNGFNPPKELEKGADVIFSYWLLPHLSLENDEPAKKTCKHMFELLKPSGRLVVGPVRNWGFGILSPYRYKGSVSHSKKENPDKVVADIVSKTKLWWLGRMVQLFSNRHRIHLASKLIGGQSKVT